MAGGLGVPLPPGAVARMASSSTGVTKVLTLLLLGILGLTGRVIPQVMEEYCDVESFKANCGPDKVIMMVAALYGRMQLGRCVKKDLGYVGCSADVIDVMDHLCSGRHECQFRIPDLDQYRDDSQTCLSELKSYLEASYKCVEVHSADKRQCQRSDHVRVASGAGYLASIVSEETGCGTGGTPWVIDMKPGQRLNLTLLDFSILDARKIEVAPGGTQVCHAYAIIREKDTKETKTVCGGYQRRQLVYTSSSSSVEVRLFSRRGTNTAPRFLLQYEAVGCPDLRLGGAYDVVRRDKVVEVRCKTSGELWRLMCSGVNWNGRIGNCTSGLSPAFGEVVLGSISLSFEISVIIISVIASFISLCILIIGIICLRRKRAAAAQQPQTVYSHRQTRKSDPYAQGNLPPTGPHENPQIGRHDGNEYACILEMPLPPPPPGVNVEMGFEARPPEAAIYESHNFPPTLQRLQKDARGAQNDLGAYPYQPYDSNAVEVPSYQDDPRYFELDPDDVTGTDANCNAGPARLDLMHARPLEEREKNPSKFSK